MNYTYSFAAALFMLGCCFFLSAQSPHGEHTRAYVPLDKRVSADYVRSLHERGESQEFNSHENKYVGMPVGGMATGQVDIQVSGKFCFYEDVYNGDRKQNRGFGNSTGYQYLNPIVNPSKIENAFAVKIKDVEGEDLFYKLNSDSFDDVRFVGEYPIARLTYKDSRRKLPIEITSEVFSSFEPHNVKASSTPMVLMRVGLKNSSKKRVSLSIGGWLKSIKLQQNEQEVKYQNIQEKTKNLSSVSLTMQPKEGKTTFSEKAKDHLNLGSFNMGILDKKAKAIVQASSIEELFKQNGQLKETAKSDELTGAGVMQDITLSPGETKHVTFVMSWYFPNFSHIYSAFKIHDGIAGRYYDNWFDSAFDVSDYVANNYEHIASHTKTFHDTYYDTTLPHWLADKMTRSLSILSAGNIYLWKNGRFYAYEGIGFCPGTCGHVYNFVPIFAQLFPSMERSVRLMQDFNADYGYNASGRINFRGHKRVKKEHHDWASDAQSGYILKVYREHLMTENNCFLDSVWEKVKMAMGYQIFKDGAEVGLRPNGVLECEQTFWDPMWYGPNPYNETLYLAALRAAEEMALIQNEPDLAARYRSLYTEGREYMDSQMWNGQYYAHLYPSGFLGAIGVYNGYKLPAEIDRIAESYIKAFNEDKPTYFKSTACDATQLFGQNWAHQLGLGQILSAENCKKAMESVYKYNFTPDMSTVYDFAKPKYRTLADKGEAAMINGSWPVEAPLPFENTHDKTDIWSGLEYDAACNMLNAGLIDQAFVVVKAIANRYDGVKRNPWNEIEGSDHYSRSMQAWNMLRSLNGTYYNGPKGILSFDPQITPEDYQAFFSVAKGYGNYKQEKKGQAAHYTLALKYGTLTLNELSLPQLVEAKEYAIKLNGCSKKVTYTVKGKQIILNTASLKLKADDVLTVESV